MALCLATINTHNSTQPTTTHAGKSPESASPSFHLSLPSHLYRHARISSPYSPPIQPCHPPAQSCPHDPLAIRPLTRTAHHDPPSIRPLASPCLHTLDTGTHHAPGHAQPKPQPAAAAPTMPSQSPHLSIQPRVNAGHTLLVAKHRQMVRSGAKQHFLVTLLAYASGNTLLQFPLSTTRRLEPR